jgi:hypothetical protein
MKFKKRSFWVSGCVYHFTKPISAGKGRNLNVYFLPVFRAAFLGSTDEDIQLLLKISHPLAEIKFCPRLFNWILIYSR